MSVSIVIPCCNGGGFLPGALESLAAQTYRDFDVIVVDDGSTDPDTLAVLDALPDDVHLIRQQNRGLPAARNAGFGAATGDLLLPLDCDDVLAPRFLERATTALDARPDKAFAFSHMRLAGDKMGVLEKSHDPFTQLFLNQLPYCLLMRRRTFEAAGGYDETMDRGYEDWEFNIRLGALGLTGVAVPEPLFVYRVSAEGMLQSLSSRLHAQLWADIQARNPALYRWPALLAARRGARPAYPAWLLLGLYGLHRLLPAAAFNGLFARLMRFSASNRAGPA